MRERRWETSGRLTFREVLAVGERLATLGLKPAHPAKDVICYVEDWAVDSPDAFDQLDHWATEDVTLLHIREAWQGDFFLLARRLPHGIPAVSERRYLLLHQPSLAHETRAAVSSSHVHVLAGLPA